MINLKKILSDELIPVILVFSVIVSLLIASKLYLTNPDKTKVLGLEDINCQEGSCGYCQNCGGVNNHLSCGKVSRCVKQNENFVCKFDLGCL